MDESLDSLVRQVRRRIELERSFGVSFDWGGRATAGNGEDDVAEAGSKADRLAALEQEMADCHACPLGKTRTNLVFGAGSAEADLVFVGEAPGQDEDEQGIPFIGRAGQLLTKIIESGMKMDRGDVYICNILKCRPPKNRNPLPTEMFTCMPYLERQLEIIQPRVICCLGGIAAKALLNTDDAVGRLRGVWHDWRGIPLMVTYHPAYLLRNPSGKAKVWSDIKQVIAKLAE